MQINHEKHCGGSLAAGGAKPPMSISLRIQSLSQPAWWQHASIVSMWPFRIVELYNIGHQSSSLFKVMRTFHLIKPFLLDDTVHALCYGIVRGLVVLRHADGGINFPQMLYVLVTAVLYATVGMMDQSAQTQICDIFNTHIQGCHSIGSHKTLRQGPSDNLMGKRVSK